MIKVSSSYFPSTLEAVAALMAGYGSEDFAEIINAEQMIGWTAGDNSNRIEGESDWVAYVPSFGRACHISNGDPVWFDATDLEDAVMQIQTGADLNK